MKPKAATPSKPTATDATAATQAVGRFCNGCNCSQSVLVAYAGRYGLDESMAMRIAVGLGGGVGRMGGTCGTLSGAALVLGLEFGPGQAGDKAAKDLTYAAAGELQRRFMEKHGSNQCRDLLNYDLSIDEEYHEARAAGVFKTHCPNYVETAVSLLDEIIDEYRKP